MKKLIYYFLVIQITFVIGNIPVYSQGKSLISIKSGIAISNQTWISKEDNTTTNGNYITGLLVGLYYDYRISNYLHIRTGMDYSQSGSYLPYSWNEYYESNKEKNRAKVLFNYLSFEILSKIKISGIKFFPYLIAGPKFDFLIKKTFMLLNFEQVPNMSNIDYGFVIGIGSEINPFKNLLVTLELRYCQGFNKISTLSSRTDVISVRNHLFEFTTGLGLIF